MKSFILAILLVVMCGMAVAQESPDVIIKSTNAVGYQIGGGSTKIDLRGNDLLPSATCEAKVEAKKGATTVEMECSGLGSPTKFGVEFLTYVLWAVSPDGRSANLGELLVKENGQGTRKTSTPLQTFSLIITAEPYSLVRMPSELVVLENEVRKGTKGKIFIVNNYQLMRKAQYQKKENPLALTLDLKKVPLEMYEARNAFEIARLSDSEKYAPEIFTKAQASLKMAENALASKANSREIVSTAVQTIQFSEDARALSVQRQTEERIANEKAAAAAKAKAEAEAKAAAEAAAAKKRTDEEARRQAELAAAKQAQMKAEAAAKEAQMKAEAAAAAARAKAEADALKAKEEAAKGEAERAQKAAEALRAKLLQQFNQVLETRDTERGLVVNMSDVLFDSGKYTLRTEAREKLARIAGIVLNYPELRLEAEGHTDNTGSAEFNQKLSEQRADSVRVYMITQGIPQGSVTSSGKGFSIPVAPNETAAGRQKNRRVELIISGEVIGTSIGKDPQP